MGDVKLPSDLEKWCDDWRDKIIGEYPARTVAREAFEALYAHLCESASEFPEKQALDKWANLDAAKGETWDYVDGARWQWSQSRAREAALVAKHSEEHRYLIDKVKGLEFLLNKINERVFPGVVDSSDSLRDIVNGNVKLSERVKELEAALESASMSFQAIENCFGAQGKIVGLVTVARENTRQALGKELK